MHGTSPQPDWLEDLVHATGLKREQAFAAMMGAWHVSIYSFLRSMLNEHDDAADATQETFLQVFRSIDTFRGEAKFSTWLYTIARRKGLDALRSRKQLALRHAHSDASDWEARLEADPFLTGMKPSGSSMPHFNSSPPDSVRCSPSGIFRKWPTRTLPNSLAHQKGLQRPRIFMPRTKSKPT